MNPEEIYSFCMGLPHAEEAFPFDENTLVFRIGGKMFAVLPLEKPNLLIVKCDPVDAAWHFNKKHWNQIDLSGHIPIDIIKSSIVHSYELVKSKLPKQIQNQLK